MSTLLMTGCPNNISSTLGMMEKNLPQLTSRSRRPCVKERISYNTGQGGFDQSNPPAVTLLMNQRAVAVL